MKRDCYLNLCRRIERIGNLDSYISWKHHPLRFSECLGVADSIIMPTAGKTEFGFIFPISTGKGKVAIVKDDVVDLELTSTF